MSSPELISVIVPCYNIAPYIESCVKTILQQTYTSIEVILVDDGSTDGTADILDRLALMDARIRVIHQPNGGVTRARFAGIEAAKGDWIGFVDGDDAIEPDMYERLLENAHKYGADISHCGYQMVFPSRVDYYYNTGRLVKQDRQSGLKDLIAGSFIEPGLCNKLYNKTLLHSLLHSGKIDFSITQMEDLLMNFYLFSESDTSIFEDFCPYHYLVRMGSSSVTVKTNEHKLRDPLRVLEIIKTETADDPELRHTVNARIVGMLIGLATMPSADQPNLIKPHRAAARKQLRAMVPEILKGPYSKRTKLLSLWTVFWPWSYYAVHRVYARLRGTDKKYEVS